MEYVLPNARSYQSWTVGNVEVGQFLTELLNFAVVAVVVFVVVAKVGAALTRRRHEQEVAARPAAPKAPAARRPTWSCSPRSATCSANSSS